MGMSNSVLRCFRPLPAMVISFPTWVSQSVPKSFFSTNMVSRPSTRFSLLPAVNRDDVKRMSTAEISLYLKAKKPRGYDVGFA